MMGRLHISGDLARYDRSKLRLIKSAVSFYKSYLDVIDNPTIYYHTKPKVFFDDNSLMIMEYVSENGKKSMIFISSVNPAGRIEVNPRISKFEQVSVFPDQSDLLIENKRL